MESETGGRRARARSARSLAAEAKFHSCVTERGETALGKYLNARTRVLIQCANGHVTPRRPDHVMEGRLCLACIGRDPAIAAAAFRARVAEQGGTVLGTYVNIRTAVLIRCKAAHEWTVQPRAVQQGQGICGVCSEWDPVAAWAAFVTQVAARGGTVLEPEWVGADIPAHVRCKVGHDCWPTPGNVRRGRGICHKCAGHAWDAFYVVTSSAGVKFGITSGDPRPRLSNHRRTGYCATARLLTGLPGNTARQMEQAVLATLRLARICPLKGQEHFDIDALPVVLDVVDNYPIDNQEQEVA